ncbi:MAG: T9SS type A sorting domain-containing protein [Bacteroidales bacterium]|nr:T9SS type A sorting domain-containing protein [Bacteroidales bacterium]
MPYKKYIVAILIFGIGMLANAQEKDAYELLLEQITKYGQVEVTFEYPGFSELTEIGKFISVSNLEGNLVHCVLSERDISTFLAFNLSYKIITRKEAKAVESALTVEEAMNWDLYPTYPQYDTIIHKLAADYPLLCRVDTIGESIQGRLILALKISDNVNEDEDEPEVFYTANMHGDELQGFVLMLRLAEHLLVNAGNGALEQALIDSLEIWINPLSNPDGTYHGGDTITFPTRANSNGTDLNRNFPDPLKPGEVPEPENEAMINFMGERNFVISANFHGGAELFNFPWDRWLSKIPADSVWFYYIGRRYADTVHNYSVPSYMDAYSNGVVRGAIWYILYGGRQDFVTYELQGREVTIELDITKETPAAQLPLLWDYNYRSFLGYLENAFYGIHGRIIDKDTGQPVAAKIFIAGHDKDSSHVYSDSLYGSFVRMLSPGTWNLTISADGYETETVSGIVLDEMEQKFITVELMGASGIDHPHDFEIRIWPVPAGNNLFISTDKLIGRAVTIRIYNQSGITAYNIENVFVDENQILIDISNLPQGFYIISISDINGYTYNRRFIKY